MRLAYTTGCCAVVAMDKIGGYESMVNQFLGSAARDTYLRQSLYQNASCGFPPADSFHIFRSMDSNYPWPGLVFGLTLLATYYWCTQQVRLPILSVCVYASLSVSLSVCLPACQSSCMSVYNVVLPTHTCYNRKGEQHF